MLSQLFSYWESHVIEFWLNEDFFFVKENQVGECFKKLDIQVCGS